MSDPTGNAFLAISTSDGSVHTTIRDFTTGKWSSFETVSPLSGHKIVDVKGVVGLIYATDNLRRPNLWLTHDFGGWRPATRLLTAITPVVASQSDSFIGLIGVGVSTAGTGFSLPLFVMEGAATPPTALGDQLSAIDPGPLDLTDFPASLAIEGDFNLRSASYKLCLATGSGGLFFAQTPDPAGARPQFIDLKAVAGDPGVVVSVGCSSAGDGLQLCAVDGAGDIQHAYRSSSTGSWSSFGDVSAGSGITFVQVAVKAFDGIGFKNPILHVVGVSNTGGLYHTIRRSDGSWLPFSDIKSDAGDP